MSRRENRLQSSARVFGRGILPIRNKASTLHPQQSQQSRISPKKIDVRDPVAALDDHLKKREDLGRDRIATPPAFEMGKTTVELFGQSDVFGKSHEPAFGGNRGFFFYRRKQLSTLTRIFGSGADT